MENAAGAARRQVVVRATFPNPDRMLRSRGA